MSGTILSDIPFSAADELLRYPVLILSPHFDDEVLGCGHLMAGAARKRELHVAYGTRGDLLPAGLSAGENREHVQSIGETRRSESLRALAMLGVPAAQAHFLDVPERAVARQRQALSVRLAALLEQVRPGTVVMPFRYDQHVDHIAMHRIARAVIARMTEPARILEYFVYHHYPLLPRRDIRRYCAPSLLKAVRPDPSAKRAALECFVSQATLYFRGQQRPVLSRELIEERSAAPEFFFDGSAPAGQGLAIPACLVRCAQFLQPRLKRIKESLRTRVSA